MRRTNYGSGAGRQKWRRINRRIAEHVATVDERDIGIRADMGEVLGFGEVTFRGRANRWFKRPPF